MCCKKIKYFCKKDNYRKDELPDADLSVYFSTLANVSLHLFAIKTFHVSSRWFDVLFVEQVRIHWWREMVLLVMLLLLVLMASNSQASTVSDCNIIQCFKNSWLSLARRLKNSNYLGEANLSTAPCLLFYFLCYRFWTEISVISEFIQTKKTVQNFIPINFIIFFLVQSFFFL